MSSSVTLGQVLAAYQKLELLRFLMKLQAGSKWQIYAMLSRDLFDAIKMEQVGLKDMSVGQFANWLISVDHSAMRISENVEKRARALFAFIVEETFLGNEDAPDSPSHPVVKDVRQLYSQLTPATAGVT